MADHDALGLARGARGVDDVCEILRRKFAFQILIALSRDCFPITVDTHHARIACGQPACETMLG